MIVNITSDSAAFVLLNGKETLQQLDPLLLDEGTLLHLLEQHRVSLRKLFRPLYHPDLQLVVRGLQLRDIEIHAVHANGSPGGVPLDRGDRFDPSNALVASHDPENIIMMFTTRRESLLEHVASTRTVIRVQMRIPKFDVGIDVPRLLI